MTEHPAADTLRQFFETSQAAARATRPLSDKAEVAVRFTDREADYRFTVTQGKGTLLAERAKDPDFNLELAPGALKSITELPGDDLGEFAIAFFKCLLTDDPDNRAKVKLNAGFLQLTRRGYLKTMALGGTKVLFFVAKKGFKGPMGLKRAIDKLRKSH